MSNLKLLFHDVIELIATIATIGSFVIVLKSRKVLENNYFLVIGIALFFVGVFEIAQFVSNHVSVALQSYDHNLHVQLYVAARYVLNISLVIAPLLISRKKINFAAIFLVYTLVSVLLFGSIFYWKIFPDCYIESSGLTNFELNSEYIVSQMLVVSLGLLFWKYSSFDRPVLILLGISMVSSMSSEISFAPYAIDNMFPNIAGHIFMVVSYCLMYAAVRLARKPSHPRQKSI